MKRILVGLFFILGASAAASAQSLTYYFPQIAAGGDWRTTIFLTNASADGVATGSVTFTKSDGTAFAANWLDEAGGNVSGGGNVIAFQLAPGESRKFISLGDLPLTVGYATVTANASVLGAAMFTLLDGGGAMHAEAGVPMAIPLGKQAIFVDTTNGFRTGVAVVNPNNSTLQIHFQLQNDRGQVVAEILQPLDALHHMAVFVDELFPGLGPFVGRMQFWCTNPMAAVGLRFSPTVQFTTLPPIAVAN